MTPRDPAQEAWDRAAAGFGEALANLTLVAHEAGRFIRDAFDSAFWRQRTEKLKREIAALVESWRIEREERIDRERRSALPVRWPSPPSHVRHEAPPRRVAWTAALRAFS